MKKVTALFIICLLQCTTIPGVIQPTANKGMQSCNNVCNRAKCSDKQATNTLAVIGLFQPGNRLNN